MNYEVACYDFCYTPMKIARVPAICLFKAKQIMKDFCKANDPNTTILEDENVSNLQSGYFSIFKNSYFPMLKMKLCRNNNHNSYIRYAVLYEVL